MAKVPSAATFFPGDVYSNDVDSFRIDSLAADGRVTIRFRSREFREKLNFFGSVKVFLNELQNESRRHEGEWFFGSSDELQSFIAENGYEFKKRGGKQGD